VVLTFESHTELLDVFEHSFGGLVKAKHWRFLRKLFQPENTRVEVLVDDPLELVIDLGEILVVNAQHPLQLDKARLSLPYILIDVLPQLAEHLIDSFRCSVLGGLLARSVVHLLPKSFYLPD